MDAKRRRRWLLLLGLLVLAGGGTIWLCAAFGGFDRPWTAPLCLGAAGLISGVLAVMLRRL